MDMHLRIITQEREVVNVKTNRVVLPGAIGQMEILPGHARLAALLAKGDVLYTDNGTKRLEIEGGLCEATDDNITILISGREAHLTA
jgi:F-type H+-transporting ATPase subunit epsilon